MKYCPKCKVRAPAEAAACPRCAGPLRTVGEAPATVAEDPTGAADANLSLQLAGLQHAVERSRATLLLVSCLAALVLVALGGLVVGWHYYQVFQFAEVSAVTVRPDEAARGEAQIEFTRRGPGKVEFVRESAGRIETLIDHGAEESAAGGAAQSFVWSADDTDEFRLVARFRDGWRVTERAWRGRQGRLEAEP